jgi:hypothetical protein
MQLNDAENLFLEEIRNKKAETASWKSSQKFKRLGKGNMRFASDFMNRKEKIEHKRAGTVTTSNIYDEFLDLETFKALETHEQRNRLQYLRSKYTIKEIQDGMGIAHKKYYDLIDELGLPKTRAHSKPRTRKGTTAPKRIEQPTIAMEAPPVMMAPPVQEIMVDGMHLIFNGTYTPEELQRQLLKYAGLLDGENDDFYIEMKMVQKKKAAKISD